MVDEQRSVKVFGTDSDFKALGELLSNETSRKIICTLMNKEMYTNQISNTLGIRVSSVIHHLTKMKEIGLLEITNKKIKRKGKEHRFFKIKSNIFIIPDKTTEEIEEKGLLKKIFRDGIKISLISIAILVSITTNLNTTVDISTNSYDLPELFFVPLLILTTSMAIQLIYNFKKKKRN